MPLLLLLQTTVPSWLAYTGLFSIIISLIGLGFGVYSLFRKESREDKAAREAEQAAWRKKIEDVIGQFVDKTALTSKFNALEQADNAHNMHREEAERRLQALETNDAKQETRLSGFQQSTERLADSLEQRYKSIESQMSEVGRVREDMAGVKAELKHISEGYQSINAKLDRLLERQMK